MYVPQRAAYSAAVEAITEEPAHGNQVRLQRHASRILVRRHLAILK